MTSRQNTPAAPGAEGLPAVSRLQSVTRRIFLGRIAAAPLAAVPALAAAPAVLAAPAQTENAALLALLPEVEAAGQEYVLARSTYELAFKTAREIWPRAPNEIARDRIARGDDRECDVSGVARWGSDPISNTRTIQEAIARTRGKRGAAQTRRALAVEMKAAQDYEASCERARAFSGFPGADERRNAAIARLDAIVRKTALEDAHTMEGVRIKAQAVAYWQEVPLAFRLKEMLETCAAENLALAILDVAEKERT